jgi:hypothetical protein
MSQCKGCGMEHRANCLQEGEFGTANMSCPNYLRFLLAKTDAGRTLMLLLAKAFGKEPPARPTGGIT